MGRRLLLLTASAALLVVAACGSEERISDSEVIEALELEPGADDDTYAVRGDPFCSVSRILNDREQVEAAGDGDPGLVIADSDERVGVQAVPPFDPRCARRAQRALDRLLE